LRSWSETPQNNVAQFVPEVGAPKMRSRSTANGATASCYFILTPTQLGVFNTFYETTLVSGALPFDWTHPILGTQYSWCFAAAPQTSDETAGAMRVSVQLIRLP
jgi:hypothetical protein